MEINCTFILFLILGNQNSFPAKQTQKHGKPCFVNDRPLASGSLLVMRLCSCSPAQAPSLYFSLVFLAHTYWFIFWGNFLLRHQVTMFEIKRQFTLRTASCVLNSNFQWTQNRSTSSISCRMTQSAVFYNKLRGVTIEMYIHIHGCTYFNMPGSTVLFKGTQRWKWSGKCAQEYCIRRGRERTFVEAILILSKQPCSFSFSSTCILTIAFKNLPPKRRYAPFSCRAENEWVLLHCPDREVNFFFSFGDKAFTNVDKTMFHS